MTIRALRAVRRMTQSELSKAAGISRPILVAIEAGAVMPSATQVKRIEAIFEVSLDEAEKTLASLL